MDSTQRFEQLVQCLIHVVGRAAVSEEQVRKIVATGEKQVEAFNLCDGTLTQKEVVEKVGLDQGSVSRSMTRWVENGVAFWIGEGSDARLLHIFPIPLTKVPRAKTPKMKKTPRRRQ